MILKICRMRDPEDISTVSRVIRPDMMGFDFSMARSSYIGEIDESLLSAIDKSIKKVGVFYDEPTVEIAAVAGRFSLDAVQLDGNTSVSDCELLSALGLEVIKTFYISECDNFFRAEQYEGVCNRFIFKLSTTLDYSILNHYHGSTPFMLSMKMDNVMIPVVDHPQFCGFCTANSCESSPGVKQVDQLKKLAEKIRPSVHNIL